MPSPANYAGFGRVYFIQTAADCGFEIVHNAFDGTIRRNNNMNVIGPDMYSQQVPGFSFCDLYDRIQCFDSMPFIHNVGFNSV